MIAHRLGGRTTWLLILGVALAAAPASAQEYKLAALAEAPPAEALAEPFIAALQETGFRLTRGEDQVVCDLWFLKTWEVPADFQPSMTVLYPFKLGQLIGALRFPRSGEDFREQTIDRGVYTLRYMQQPVDGNHVGTSPTLDFLLMVRAAEDRSLDPIDAMRLIELSTTAAQSGHPAILSLQTPGEKPETAPVLTHNEASEWWVATFVGQAKTGEMTKETVLKAVLIGKGMD